MAMAKTARGDESIIQVVIQRHYKDALLSSDLQRNQTDASSQFLKFQSCMFRVAHTMAVVLPLS